MEKTMENDVVLLSPYLIKDFLFAELTGTRDVSCYIVVLLNTAKENRETLINIMYDDITKAFKNAMDCYLEDHNTLHVKSDETFASELTKMFKNQILEL